MVSVVDYKMGRVVDKKMKSKLANPIEVKEMEKKLKRKPPRAKIPICRDVLVSKKFKFTPFYDEDAEDTSIEIQEQIGEWLDRLKLPLETTLEYTVELKWKEKTYVNERRVVGCDGTKGNYHKRR